MAEKQTHFVYRVVTDASIEPVDKIKNPYRMVVTLLESNGSGQHLRHWRKDVFRGESAEALLALAQECKYPENRSLYCIAIRGTDGSKMIICGPAMQSAH